jgi:hypothetical protein
MQDRILLLLLLLLSSSLLLLLLLCQAVRPHQSCIQQQQGPSRMLLHAPGTAAGFRSSALCRVEPRSLGC